MAEARVCSSASAQPSRHFDPDLLNSACLVAITTGEMMRLVNDLNAISSQVWAVVLILLGIATFGMACLCGPADVRVALMSSGTGMIGGGIAMFQHQPKSSQTSNEITSRGN